MVVSSQNFTKSLIQAFGEEFSSCAHLLQIQEFAPGKAFWQTTDACPGIYLVLEGKVRLLDSCDRPIVSLEAGKSFGEMTLFPAESFQPYTARASFNLKLGYLSDKHLETIIRKVPTIRDRLYEQAIRQDLLVLCRQIDVLQNAPSELILQVLSLLEKHSLAVGKLPATLLQGQKLCLLRQGELINSSDNKLIAGNFAKRSRKNNFPI